MTARTRTAAAAVAVLALLLPPAAAAAAPLPASADDVELVGELDVGPEGSVVGDLTTHTSSGRQLAYVASSTADCTGSGLHLLDLGDLGAPTEVTEGYIPATDGSAVREAVVHEIGGRDVLIHQNETCNDDAPGPFGGISLWDVTDPSDPILIVAHVGDTTVAAGEPPLTTPDSARSVHALTVWTDDDGSTYAALVDNDELTDVDLLDLTDPENPTLANDTLDLDARFGVGQESAPDTPLGTLFANEVEVQRAQDGRTLLTVGYWDGGYVILDVTDPTAVTLVQETDFEAVDPELEKSGQGSDPRGVEISPEGSASQVELSGDGGWLVGASADPDPYRTVGRFSDLSAFSSGTGSDGAAPPDGQPWEAPAGSAAFLGDGCGPVLPASDTGATTGVVERGGSPTPCNFSVKVENIQNAGYDAAVVVNSSVAGGCSAVLDMGTPDAGQVPAYFVGRDTGFALFGAESDYDEDDCQAGGQAFPAAAGDLSAESVSIDSVFGGWGYLTLHAIDSAAAGSTVTGAAATWAVPESQDPAFAAGTGNLGAAEVALDPAAPGIAYATWHSAGLRVIEYGADGLREVGSFVGAGADLTGVETYQRDGTTFALATDSGAGLQVFRYGAGQPPPSADPTPAPGDPSDPGSGDPGSGDPGSGDPDDSIRRVSGDDRIDTAIAVSREFLLGFRDGDDLDFRSRAGGVVLARSDVFADSLAGTPLAVAEDAPLLLTGGDALDDRTADEIVRLLPQGAPVVLLGGEDALSAQVEDDVEALGYDVVRYGGRSRFETAAIVARDGLGSPDTVLLADGNGFPDAVSAGAAAVEAGGAVLLTGGSTPSTDTDRYLAAESRTSFAVGGPAAAAYPDAQALVGDTRYGTAVAVAGRFFPDPSVAGLATGGDFADALAGGAGVARLGGPLLLVGQDAPLPDATRGYLEARADRLSLGFLFGGPDAASEGVRAAALDAITAPPAPPPDPSTSTATTPGSHR